MTRKDEVRSDMSEIFSLTESDKAAAVEIWVESFYDYPAMREYFIGHARTEQQYSNWLQAFVGLSFDMPFYLDYPLLGIRDEEGQLLAAMGCVDTVLPKAWPDTLHNAYANFSDKLGEEGVRRLEHYEEVAAKQHPPMPHYFVDILGVRINHRGKGYARQLLQELQSRSAADPKSTGVFLDTEKADNVQIYKRLGYQLIAQSDVEGMHCWHFFRADDN